MDGILYMPGPEEITSTTDTSKGASLNRVLRKIYPRGTTPKVTDLIAFLDDDQVLPHCSSLSCFFVVMPYPTRLSACLPACLSVYLSVCLHVSVQRSVCPSVCVCPACLPVSVNQCVHLSYLTVRPPVCPSLCPSSTLSVCVCPSPSPTDRVAPYACVSMLCVSADCLPQLLEVDPPGH